jgi:hypothetical protein
MLSSKMPLSIADHEILIRNALSYYRFHKESVSICKVILLFVTNSVNKWHWDASKWAKPVLLVVL